MGASERAVSVVAPTYREAANIAALAERVGAALSGSGVRWELILVDDDSQDGSERIAAELARRLPVRMEVRRDAPRDLSAAVLAGIRSARYHRVVVLDADLSHPPERIPDLLATLDSGDCDLVVGSRYAPGGRLDRAWSPRRFLASRLATRLARPLASCSDPLSGFFAADRRSLPEQRRLRPLGYKIGLELMVRGRLRIREVPIGFSERGRGSSKLNWRQQFRFLRHLLRLYLHRFGGPVRLAGFGLVAASGFAVDLAGYLGLQEIGLEHRLARLLSVGPAVGWNRLLACRPLSRTRFGQWLGKRPTDPPARRLVGLAVSIGSYAVLTGFVAPFDRLRLLAFLCGVGLGGIVKFLIAELSVYRRHAAPR